MPEPNEPEKSDEAARMDEVDANPNVHRATEQDEMQVLTALYGEPDVDGVFRGEEVSPGG
ncbi:hypothetical protein [Thermomonospora umbrina]|uniref:Uncharacterized protein n=1 Tax=Thermomonospora umbrina TaxID=111806 RepID=A0A3D9STH2_9ACTN|nr:hypothetical protein [Thermomonospora umbrina]REE97303.1 hypothetical protein DFJ69_2769 [Thermomonospora umbrina]